MGTSDTSFEVLPRTVGGALVLAFSGELDAWAALQLSPQVAVLIARPRPDVIMDLRRVTFLDAGGLRLLLTVRDRVAARQGVLRVLPAAPRVWRVVHITGLEGEFPVAEGIPDDSRRPDPPMTATSPG
ncbi:STAS domain-containing protein [Actinomycetota bacterium Odt1-20B]